MRNYFVFLAICFVAFFSFCEGGFEYKGKQSQEKDLLISDNKDDIVEVETYIEDIYETETNGFMNQTPIDPTLEQLYGNLNYNQEEKDFFEKIYEKTGIEFGKGGSYDYSQLIHSCHKKDDLTLESCFDAAINIRFYVITKKGEWAVDSDRVNKDLAALNAGAFSNMKLSFQSAGEIKLVESEKFWIINNTKEFHELLDIHSSVSEWPVFYVKEMYIEGGKAAGAALLASNSGVVLSYMEYYDSHDKGDTIIHEFGHQLALFHTFNEFFEEEECDGSNCWEAADLVCDTPADRWEDFECENKSSNYCEAECKKCSTPPSKHNFMSYYDRSCLDRFTYRQKAVMCCFLKDLVD